jgi:hypothetical protein
VEVADLQSLSQRRGKLRAYLFLGQDVDGAGNHDERQRE